ncbi:phosphate acetyltransferase [bacterium]|nr:phosphate acetyltransferase [bacterium]
MTLIDQIQQKAKSLRKHIVLPEGEDDRMLLAADQLVRQKICDITLIGNPDLLDERAKALGISMQGIQCVDPAQSEKFEPYAEAFMEMRKHKGVDIDGSRKLMRKPLYYGAMMVHQGDADGSVAGANNTTGDVLRAGIHCIGLKPGISVVSSIFLMIVPGWSEVLTYADGGVVPDPTAEELASIAITSAKTHRLLTGNTPNVAMLSFSTYGSASHKRVDKIKEAARIVKEKAPDLNADGEMQADAALIPEIGRKKAPGSSVAGMANVLIFPDLDSGNIAYKLTERLAGATALGPLIQGLKKPAMDLSRGCSADDIVNVAAICSVLAGE